MALRLFDSPTVALSAYQTWLITQPLAYNTRLAYRQAVAGYCTYLASCPPHSELPLANENARNYAVRDYKLYLKTVTHHKPTSVNLALAGLDHFYSFLGLGRPQVSREDLPQHSPRALEPSQQKNFLRAVERCSSKRNQALALLLFYTALRIGEGRLVPFFGQKTTHVIEFTIKLINRHFDSDNPLFQ